MKSGMQFILYANRPVDRPEMAEFIHGYTDRSIFPDYEIGMKNEDEMMDNNANAKRAPRTGANNSKSGQLASKVGICNKFFESRAFMQHSPDWMCKAEIDTDKCIGCGTCMTSCRDNGNNAIVVDAKGVVKVDNKYCIGCALCSTVCPVKAITMREVEDAKERTLNYRM